MVQAVLAKACGARPLGLAVRIVVNVIDAVLFLTMPWVFRHAGLIAYQAHFDGRRFSLVYLGTAGAENGSFSRSLVKRLSKWDCG
jgi:hypothetical protein